MAKKLSKAKLQGLLATSRGEVFRTHTRTVCTLTGPVGSVALWQLVRDGLIVDPPPSRPRKKKMRMLLTEAGKAALRAAATPGPGIMGAQEPEVIGGAEASRPSVTTN